MKFLVTALLLISSSAVLAQNGSSLGDLLYMQNKGEIVYNNDATLSYGKYKVSRYDTSGTKLQNLERETRKVFMNQTLTYGFSDHLFVGAGVEIAFRNETQNTMRAYNNGNPIDLEPRVKNPGFSDPYLTSQYRFLTEKENGINWDIYTKITPSIVSAQRGRINGSKASQGDYQQGGHMIVLGTQVGKHFGDLEAMLYTSYQLNLRAQQKNRKIDNTNPQISDGGDVEFYEDMRSICSVGSTLQYRLLQHTFINLGVDVAYNSDSHKEGQLSSGNKSIENTTSFWSGQLKSELRFILLQDFYFRMGYAYSKATHSEISYFTDANKQRSEVISDTSAHNYLAGFTMKF